jgi:cytochrome P450
VILNLIDPKLLKEFFIEKESLYEKTTPLIMDCIQRVAGNGLVFSEGAIWKNRRKILSNAFHFDFLNNLIPKILEINDEVFKDTIKSDSFPVDISEMFHRTAAEVVVKSFFGNSFKD